MFNKPTTVLAKLLCKPVACRHTGKVYSLTRDDCNSIGQCDYRVMNLVKLTYRESIKGSDGTHDTQIGIKAIDRDRGENLKSKADVCSLTERTRVQEA